MNKLFFTLIVVCLLPIHASDAPAQTEKTEQKKSDTTESVPDVEDTANSSHENERVRKYLRDLFCTEKTIQRIVQQAKKPKQS
jgi:hypothetical protein